MCKLLTPPVVGLLCVAVLLTVFLQDQADGMRTQLEAQQKAVDQLIANTR